MGQVRNNLPNGNPRNKIEYLADCIDAAKVASEENANTSAARPTNLLRNAAFLADDEAHQALWTCVDARSTNHHLSLCKGVGYPVAPFWCLEVQPSDSGLGDQSRVGATFRGPIENHDSADMFPDVAKAVMFGTQGIKSVLFQEIDSMGAPESYNDPASLNKDLYCYLRFASGGGEEFIKYGLVELDKHGNATRIIDSKRVQTKGTFIWCEDWLKVSSVNALMNANNRYAFFIERDEAISSSQKTMISGAGVYWGIQGERPELAKTERGTSNVFRLNKTISASGQQFALPAFPTKYEPKKQLAFVLLDSSGFVDATAKDANFSLSGDTITVTNTGTPVEPLEVWGCYVPNLYINYYAMTV
ncbi:hypothetical protein V8118_000625 [Vibrio parahaemolyticus]|uniref:hypothetical protein n=1 Tax=Vibrio parahaemolyticus TaxID=670 RepID=UPI00084A7EBA|nr:hypothetical protein [Vibrio parahaemolyticus]EGQ8009181.1 hypothetical protein [Vibrio parahaemolyticus]EHK2866614.1 hypothetical protein [Vibrio parahaemolyticus]EJG0671212.1 hypothetical protein [Vibrio parahaemolyticus]ELA9532119.1 hypothetical protein [Vibrio parahaemolyticus]ODZ76384.1 hypothetical protein BBM45_09135 [Vibrio parahaemolyticus]